ncbi:MAG: SDR family NAD(P)-dependent oxidoreductase [Nanoarchaeota archaeon]
MELDNKTILVTGGTGSIGSEIVKQLLNFKISKVIIFSRDEIKQFSLKQKLDDNRIEIFMGDIRDYDTLESIFENNKIDIVFHAAAMKHLIIAEDEPIECAKTNILGTSNLIRLCVKYKVKKTITISTDKAASPSCVMGATKFIAERITLNGNINQEQKFSCVRFGNVANSRGSVIPIMVDRIKNSKDIWITDKEVTRFLMKIPDAVKLVLKAADIMQGGEIFILKMNSFKLGDLAQLMENKIAPMFNKKIKIETKGLLVGEKLHEDLLNELELSHLIENEELFIVVKNPENYPGFKKSNIKFYNSFVADRISLKYLEEIILEYVNA